MADPVCTGALDCLFQFQTLAAGIIGTAAALITAYAIYSAARMPVKAEQERATQREARRLRLRSLELIGELTILTRRATQGKGTVIVHKASNVAVTDETRQRMMLLVPSATRDWEFMSLIPEEIARRCVELGMMIEDHNFDMERTGGAFGDDNFGRSVVSRLETIAKLAAALSQEMPGLARQS
jgi:hypothetical protein